MYSWRWLLLAYCLVVHSVSLSGCTTGAGTVTTDRPSPAGQGHEVAHYRTVTLNLERTVSAHRLTADTEVTITFFSRRATDWTTHQISDPFYAPVTRLEAEIDGKSLPAEQIVKTLPDRGDVFLSDARVYEVQFKRIRAGQSITYRYHQTYRDLVFTPVLLVPNIDQTVRYELLVNHPPDIRVDFALFQSRAPAPPRVEPTPTGTRVTFSNVSGLLPLDYYPFNHFRVAVWPKFSRDGRPISPVDAAGLARWYFKLLGQPPPFDSEQQRLVKRLVRGAATDRARVKALYDFVRDDVRYVADERNIGSIVPTPPPQVLRRRYGDCKDKAYLLARMSRLLGIPVQMVLVGSGEVPPLEGIQLWMFNHIIARHAVDGKQVYLDPTCTHCEFGSLPEQVVGKMGVVLDPSSPSRMRIPAPPQRPSLELELEARIDGLDKAHASLTLRGGLLRKLRELKRTQSAADAASGMATILSRLFYNIKLEDLKVAEVAEDRARLRARANLLRFVIRTRDRLYLPRIPFRVVASDLLQRARDDRDIFLAGRPYLTLRIKLRAPGHRAGETASEQLDVPGVARFSASLQRSGDEHLATYLYQQRAKRFAGKGRAPILDFCTRYLGTRRKLFVLKREDR